MRCIWGMLCKYRVEIYLPLLDKHNRIIGLTKDSMCNFLEQTGGSRNCPPELCYHYRPRKEKKDVKR
jgi:hypothetical protein